MRRKSVSRWTGYVLMTGDIFRDSDAWKRKKFGEVVCRVVLAEGMDSVRLNEGFH